MNENELNKKSWAYKMGALFAVTIGASSCALIIALTIKIIRWMLF